MAWPPTPSSGYSERAASGYATTSLVWGTDGLYGNTVAKTAIVKSVRASQMIEEIKIENGTGLTAIQILLNDGQDLEFTVVDDALNVWPTSGSIVTFYTGLTGNTATTFQVINSNCNNSRKQEGERVISAKRYTLIAPI